MEKKWRKRPLCNLTGTDLFQSLFYPYCKIATLLESPYPSPQTTYLARYSICAGEPSIRFGVPQMWTPPIGEILCTLNKFLSQQKPSSVPFDIPFTGGWLGWLGYDTAWEIEKLPYLKQETTPFPVAYWYEPACFAIADHQQQILYLAAEEEGVLNVLEERLGNITSEDKLEDTSYPLQLLSNQTQYQEAVEKALSYIKAGDIFQANLSLRFATTTYQNPFHIYRRLQSINPSPFASYWQTPWGMVISCSPERLVKLQGNKAETRPIAGTRPRSTTFTEDQLLAKDLLNNTKERAEHIMLVDLERNDLGKVCQVGTVEVDELFTIERYSHVMHLVSNIKGNLRTEYNGVDLIRALFPGGTITGCPKVRCMEVIEELEPFRRSLFYGSCGYLDYRGNLDLNILIRTLLYIPQPSGALVYGQVGAGIVADSHPEREWRESITKAQAQLVALGLKINL